MEVQVQYAGQIGPVEGVLIAIGILWVAGLLRSIIYVPVVIRESKKEKNNETPVNEKKKRIDPGGEYTNYEEIK